MRCYRPANGSPWAAGSASSLRVAHGGNGNVTTSGSGMAGWDTTIVPGLRRRARALVLVVAELVGDAPLRLGGVQPAGHAQRRVLEDLRRHARGGLLRAHQQHAERAPALRDVDEHVLQRSGALARRVLVELVEHDHREREPLARLLLLLEGLVQQRADDEPLRLIVQRLDRHHRDAGGGAVDAARRSRLDQVSQPGGGCVQPAHEGGHGAAHHAPAPGELRLGAVLGLEVVADGVHERGEVDDHALARRRLHRLAVLVRQGRGVAQHHGAGLTRDVDREALQLGLDAFADERDLVALVVGVGEEVGEEVLIDELPGGPGEDLDPLMAAAGVGEHDVAGAAPRRRPEPDARERRRPHPERGPSLPRLLVEVAVARVQPEEVLALDVEHEDPQVGRALADDARVLARGEHAQEEQRERGLGGHAADAAHGHVAALAPVEEIDVHVHRFAIPPEPDGQRPPHLVDIERLAALVARRTFDDLARVRGDPHLGIHPGDGDPGAADLGGGHDAELRHAVRVRLEGRALVDGLGLGDHPVRAHLARLRDLRADDDEIVELEVVLLIEDDAELAGRGVLRAQHAADAVGLVHAHEASRIVASRRAR